MDKNYLKDLKNKLIGKVEEVKNKEYTGEAGAGMVKVTVRADMYVAKIEIDHTMFAKTVPKMINDLNFLADLIKAATNQAIERGTKDLAQTYGLQGV